MAALDCVITARQIFPENPHNGMNGLCHWVSQHILYPGHYLASNVFLGCQAIGMCDTFLHNKRRTWYCTTRMVFEQKSAL